jgi:hypothetical protein
VRSFADQVCIRTVQLPRGDGLVVDQLNRGPPSISANIAEDNGRFTKSGSKRW